MQLISFESKKILKNAHIYLFYLFLFSIPFQTRKVFLTKYSFYTGDFTEYGAFFVYLSDILLFSVFLSWIFFDDSVKKSFYSLAKWLKVSFFSLRRDVAETLILKKSPRVHLKTLLGGCPECSELASAKQAISGLSRIFGENLPKFSEISEINKIWFLLTVFIFWLILNLFVNKEFFEIELYQTLKFIELALLTIYFALNFKSKIRLNLSLFVIAISGFFQSIIAIFQFTSQHSIFNSPILHKLTGEAIVSSEIIGAAKITVNGEKILRAYGTFPHPNMLGGFLIFTLGISIYLFLEHRNIILSRLTNELFYTIKSSKSQGYFVSFFWILFISTQFIALLFSFSRIAWIAFFLSILLFVFFCFRYLEKIISPACQAGKRKTISQNSSPDKRRLEGVLYDFITTKQDLLSKNVSRETIAFRSFLGKFKNFVFNCIFNSNKEIVRDSIVISIISIFSLISFFPLITARFSENLVNYNSNLPNNYAITDRVFYNNVSRETILNSPVFGSGLRTFVFQIDDYLNSAGISQKLYSWQYQPDHNIYFLMASEIGILGLLIFLLFIFNLIKYCLKSAFISVSSEKHRFCHSRPVSKYGINSGGNPVNKPDYLSKTNDFNCFLEDTSIKNTNLSVNKIVLPQTILVRGKSETISQNSSPDKGRLEGVLYDFVTTKQDLLSKNVSRETISSSDLKLSLFLISILVSFLFVGLFDHYFWTLQQGRLLFWLVLGILLALNSKS